MNKKYLNDKFSRQLYNNVGNIVNEPTKEVAVEEKEYKMEDSNETPVVKSSIEKVDDNSTLEVLNIMNNYAELED